MNTNLYGKTILLGREQDQGRLNVCVTINGQPYTFAYGSPHSVPNSVSRCQPKEGSAHCQIEVETNGRMLITNLKTQNSTYVDGNEVMKKYITESSQVAMGHSQFPLQLPAVLNIASQIVAKVQGNVPPPKATYNIDHLEKVCNNYYQTKQERKRKENQKTLLLSLPMVLSMSLGALGRVVDMESLGNIFFFIGIAAALSFVYRLIHTSKGNTEDIEIEHQFQDAYICPNKECGQFLGNQDFHVLKKKKKCPYCGCGFRTKV